MIIENEDYSNKTKYFSVICVKQDAGEGKHRRRSERRDKHLKIQNGPGRYGVFAFADKIEGGKEEEYTAIGKLKGT